MRFTDATRHDTRDMNGVLLLFVYCDDEIAFFLRLHCTAKALWDDGNDTLRYPPRVLQASFFLTQESVYCDEVYCEFLPTMRFDEMDLW